MSWANRSQKGQSQWSVDLPDDGEASVGDGAEGTLRNTELEQAVFSPCGCLYSASSLTARVVHVGITA